MPRDIVLIAHNIRSTFNIGSIFRTCDGLGVKKLYLTGYSPYPNKIGDDRLPHIVNKLHKQINKTALGAEDSVSWEYTESPESIINNLKSDGYKILALEQDTESTELNNFIPTNKIALVLGEEVNGINSKLLNLCDEIIEIPMQGAKESFNVSVACAIALYVLKFAKT